MSLVLVTLTVGPSAGQGSQQAYAFADRSAGTYLWANLGSTSPHVGRFIFAVDGAGLFWPNEAATVTVLPDGSVELSYDGSGWIDAAGTFDPLLWRYQVHGTPTATPLQLEATIGADLTTASAQLTVGGVTYHMNDLPATAGADVAIADIAALVEAEDWSSLYLRLHASFQSAIDQTSFVTLMTDSTAPHGEITVATVSSSITVTDTALGWDVGTATLGLTFMKDGRSATYAPSVEVLVDGGAWWLSNIGSITPDTTPPTSSAGPLDPSYDSEVVDVPYTANDTGVGVASVELWWRHRPDAASQWSAWAEGPAGTSSPILFTFDAGAGSYEFYSIGIDNAGNREAAPPVADTRTDFSTTPAQPITERVSESSSHGQGNGASNDSYISADGRYVTFQSDATDLVVGDTNGYTDAFVHDRVTDTTTRVSVSANGAQANQRSLDPAISADGSHLVFVSHASNLVAGDTNGKRDVFVVELATGAVERVSVGLSGAQPNQSSSEPILSADGRHVTFRTNASNLVAGDTNGLDDIFWFDRVTDTTLRVSVSSGGTQATAASDQPAISGDGRSVVFASDAANLVAGDTNAARDIFVHDTSARTTTRVSVAAGGAQANAASDDPAISDDGAVLAFESEASNLISGDTNAKQDVFVVTLASGAVERASVASDGTAGNHSSREPSLSADGRYVAFDSSASNFTAGDSNGKLDIYVHDRVSGTTTLFSVALDSALPGNHQSLNPSISGDGSTLAFESEASDLVAGDTNVARDVFVRGPAP